MFVLDESVASGVNDVGQMQAGNSLGQQRNDTGRWQGDGHSQLQEGDGVRRQGGDDYPQREDNNIYYDNQVGYACVSVSYEYVRESITFFLS